MSSHLHPSAEQAAVTAHRAPDASTDTERALAEIWCEVLDRHQVSVVDNFFDLGGHSLLLHMVQGLIVERLGANPPLVELFQHPTVRALACHLDGNDVAGAADAPRTARPAGNRPDGRTRLARQRAQRLRREAAQPGAPDQDTRPSGREDVDEHD